MEVTTVTKQGHTVISEKRVLELILHPQCGGHRRARREVGPLLILDSPVGGNGKRPSDLDQNLSLMVVRTIQDEGHKFFP